MTRKAYSFVRTFAPVPARDICVDRHYLLCASAGALRLEAQGQAWLLPPARAALIEAGRTIQVSIPQPVRTASVLFHTGFTAPRVNRVTTTYACVALIATSHCATNRRYRAPARWRL